MQISSGKRGLILALIFLAVAVIAYFAGVYHITHMVKSPTAKQQQTAVKTIQGDTKVYRETIVSLDTKIREKVKTVYVDTHKEAQALSSDAVAAGVCYELLFDDSGDYSDSGDY